MGYIIKNRKIQLDDLENRIIDYLIKMYDITKGTDNTEAVSIERCDDSDSAIASEIFKLHLITKVRGENYSYDFHGTLPEMLYKQYELFSYFCHANKTKINEFEEITEFVYNLKYHKKRGKIINDVYKLLNEQYTKVVRSDYYENKDSDFKFLNNLIENILKYKDKFHKL